MVLLTGAAGFLGREIALRLVEQGERVIALVLPGDALVDKLPPGVEVCYGDLLKPDKLSAFYDKATPNETTLIHCASIISMSMDMVDKVEAVNVQGTKNLIQLSLERNLSRFIHVASVHAIPELPHGEVMLEPENTDPGQVVGCYAKTKAQGVQAVMDARKTQGLNASIVYPAGLCGPGDYAKGNLTQMFDDYLSGRIRMAVHGGYNFADVRDVAQAIATLALSEHLGEDYVLSGEFISILDILDVFHQVTGKRKVTKAVPMWLAKAALPLFGLYYRLRKVKPVFSAYSLYTVSANCLFDASKAKQDLGFAPRPIRDTLKDTAKWLLSQQTAQN